MVSPTSEVGRVDGGNIKKSNSFRGHHSLFVLWDIFKKFFNFLKISEAKVKKVLKTF